MVNWERVKEMRRDFGDDGFDEIFDLFVTETSEAFERLRGADGKAAAEEVHFIKGSAENLGLSHLAHQCRAAETASQNGTPPDAADLERAFEQGCAEIRSRCAAP